MRPSKRPEPGSTGGVLRWWATDPALVECLAEPSDPRVAFAQKRLELINRFYTVYTNLILVDGEGLVMAASSPHLLRRNEQVADLAWYRQAMNTVSGDEYVVDEIRFEERFGGKASAIYAAGVRDSGDVHGKVLGVLAINFDWHEQARVIVCDEPNLTAEEKQRSRVLLLDRGFRVIADSRGSGTGDFYPLELRGQAKGHYRNEEGQMVAFAQTLGYQEYDGLGWYGVVIQDPA